MLEVLVSNDSTQEIIDALHERDDHSVVNDAYTLFNDLIFTR